MTNCERYRNFLDSALHNMPGCHTMRLEDLPLPKSKDDFYTILFKILLFYLTDLNCLGIFRLFNYSLLLLFYIIIISHNKNIYKIK